MNTNANLPGTAPAVPPKGSLDRGLLEPGNLIRLRVGHEVLSGTIDHVMPDQSCFWIWTDGGMGRRLIETSDADLASVVS